jgi:hypothetical protein
VKIASGVKLETTTGRADLGASVALANLSLGNPKDAAAAVDAVLRKCPPIRARSSCGPSSRRPTARPRRPPR